MRTQFGANVAAVRSVAGIKLQFQARISREPRPWSLRGRSTSPVLLQFSSIRIRTAAAVRAGCGHLEQAGFAVTIEETFGLKASGKVSAYLRISHRVIPPKSRDMSSKATLPHRPCVDCGSRSPPRLALLSRGCPPESPAWRAGWLGNTRRLFSLLRIESPSRVLLGRKSSDDAPGAQQGTR